MKRNTQRAKLKHERREGREKRKSLQGDEESKGEAEGRARESSLVSARPGRS